MSGYRHTKALHWPAESICRPGFGLFQVAALANGSRLMPGSQPAHEPGVWAPLTGSRGSPPFKGEPMSRSGTSVPAELLLETRWPDVLRMAGAAMNELGNFSWCWVKYLTGPSIEQGAKR